MDREFSAREVQRLLQHLFPARRLVLSQLTFFSQHGISRPTGSEFRRGRQCYKLPDILPVASVLALKSQGIPLRNIQRVPAMLQEHAKSIFEVGPGCRLSGTGHDVALYIPGRLGSRSSVIDLFLSGNDCRIYWSFDVGALAQHLVLVCQALEQGTLEHGSLAFAVAA